MQGHGGIYEKSILLTVSHPASSDAGIRGKPLDDFPPNSRSLILTEVVRKSHRVAPMMPQCAAFLTAGESFIYKI